MKTILSILVVIALIAFCNSSKIVKINRGWVCFSAAHNRPGVFRYYGSHGRIVNGLLLVRRRGYLTCNRRSFHYRSKWGCGGTALNVVVTDIYNHLIYPPKQFIHHHRGLWYRLPGKHSKHSNSLLFTDVSTPFHLTRYQRLKIWYGEDLKNWTEGDNGGRLCVDVYAWIA